jgi:hypothetical protein
MILVVNPPTFLLVNASRISSVLDSGKVRQRYDGLPLSWAWAMAKGVGLYVWLLMRIVAAEAKCRIYKIYTLVTRFNVDYICIILLLPSAL